MPQLTFPIITDGLMVDALVNVEANLVTTMRAAGQPRPPIQAKGLIDTGSNASVVTLPILQQLGLSPHKNTTTFGIGGTVRVNLYHVSLYVFDAAKSWLPALPFPKIEVMELGQGFDFEVLIGRDILVTIKTFIDGPGGEFTLDF